MELQIDQRVEDYFNIEAGMPVEFMCEDDMLVYIWSNYKQEWESRMSMIDELLSYMNNQDKKILIKTDIQLSIYELNVVVIEILSWLKLEYKRSVWINEGRKNCLKPLAVDVKYPWCANLYKLVDKEKLFRDNFSIKDGKFNFSDMVSEKEKKIAREKAYQNYNPQRHT